MEAQAGLEPTHPGRGQAGVVFCSPAEEVPQEGTEIQGSKELCSGCVTGAQATEEGRQEPEGLG